MKIEMNDHFIQLNFKALRVDIFKSNRLDFSYCLTKREKILEIHVRIDDQVLKYRRKC